MRMPVEQHALFKAQEQWSDWRPSVPAAMTIHDENTLNWHAVSDVIVVGMGGAGAATCVQALEDGLQVVALERFEGGGSTTMNGGIYYAGGGTHIQQAAGVQDSPQAMFDYLKRETGGVVSDRTLMNFCQSSASTLSWLERHGVRFKPSLYNKKTSYPPLDYYLYHSDSSMSGGYAAHTPPAARGHKVFSEYRSQSALGFGKDLYEPLRNSALKQGLSLYTHCEVTRLVCNPQGRVIGVQAMHYPNEAPKARSHHRWVRWANVLQTTLPPTFPGGQLLLGLANWARRRADALALKYRIPIYLRAKAGVCLTTGGFVFNRDWVNRLAPVYNQAMPLGNAGDDGSGIALGVSAGAATDRMDHLSAWRFINPPSAFSKGILVNQHGQRMVDETNYGAALGYAMCRHNNGKGWLIVDHNLYRLAKHQIRHDGLLPFQRDPARLLMMFASVKANTVAALADKLGIDSNALARTVAAYNQVSADHSMDRFEKNPADCVPLVKGPFYAFDMSVHSRLFPLPSITLGGLRVDEQTGAVLNTHNTPIQGLYAAGRTAVGVCSHLYVSGLSAADCIYSGRRAARSLVAQVTQ